MGKRYLVLDIGGIHGAEDGVIDFSTGQVTVQGQRQTSLMDLGISAGDHTLSVLYLERGSSRSNCKIRFNLSPRYSLTLQKEDVLTRELLNGIDNTVGGAPAERTPEYYRDRPCTRFVYNAALLLDEYIAAHPPVRTAAPQ